MSRMLKKLKKRRGGVKTRIVGVILLAYKWSFKVIRPKQHVHIIYVGHDAPLYML